ncbi:hypothetical protein ACI65C_007080 [Semiaphis heraclei]
MSPRKPSYPETSAAGGGEVDLEYALRVCGKGSGEWVGAHQAAASTAFPDIGGDCTLYSDSNVRQPTAEEAPARTSSAQQLSLPLPPPSPVPRTDILLH